METASAIRRVHGQPQPSAGRKRGISKPAQKRTDRIITYGFLKHRFLPLWNGSTDTEREFFDSLSHLCRLYGWTMPDVSGFEFPRNVWQAFNAVKQQCDAHKLDCMIMSDHSRKATIVTAKRFDTGYTLYYIPVKPLWILLTQAKGQPLAAVLVEVIKYLCQVSGVAWCGDGSYMMNEYDTIQDWIEADDSEDADRREELQELALYNMAVRQMDTLIKTAFSPDDLRDAIAAYTKSPIWELETTCLLEDFAAFCASHPRQSITELTGRFAECEENERIYLHEYLSCYWSSNGSVAQTLFDSLDARFQECTVQDEPLSVQWFDAPQQSEEHDFSYIERFFQLVNRLAQLLNDIDDEQYNEQL